MYILTRGHDNIFKDDFTTSGTFWKPWMSDGDGTIAGEMGEIAGRREVGKGFGEQVVFPWGLEANEDWREPFTPEKEVNKDSSTETGQGCSGGSKAAWSWEKGHWSTRQKNDFSEAENVTKCIGYWLLSATTSAFAQSENPVQSMRLRNKPPGWGSAGLGVLTSSASHKHLWAPSCFLEEQFSTSILQHVGMFNKWFVTIMKLLK